MFWEKLMIISQPRRHLAVFGALLLTGCASVYRPPLTGPTAMLNITIRTSFAASVLEIVPPGHSNVFGKQMIAHNDFKNNTSFSKVELPADQRYLFIYDEIDGSEECKLTFHFMAKPDSLYYLYIGGTLPPPQHTVLGKIGHFLYPAIGGKCLAIMWRKLPDGSKLQIPIRT